MLTLITNLLGAVLIGWIAAAAQKSGLSQNAVLFLKTGLCGGFTTFSTFSLEAAALLQRGSFASAALYVLLSLFGCIGGVYLGGLAAK